MPQQRQRVWLTSWRRQLQLPVANHKWCNSKCHVMNEQLLTFLRKKKKKSCCSHTWCPTVCLSRKGSWTLWTQVILEGEVFQFRKHRSTRWRNLCTSRRLITGRRAEEQPHFSGCKRRQREETQRLRRLLPQAPDALLRHHRWREMSKHTHTQTCVQIHRFINGCLSRSFALISYKRGCL